MVATQSIGILKFLALFFSYQQKNPLESHDSRGFFWQCRTLSMPIYLQKIKPSIPKQPTPQNTETERQPVSLEERHAAYTAMLEHLTLLDRHRNNLLERGLSEERIVLNQYRSMPETDRNRVV